MKNLVKTALIAVSLLLSAGPGFAAEVKAAAKTAGDGVKVNANAPVAAPTDSSSGKTAVAKVPVKAKLVDINSATDVELKAVPGIGDAYAAKIVAGRPYANKAQLKSRKIVPSKVYEQIKDKIIARLSKK